MKRIITLLILAALAAAAMCACDGGDSSSTLSYTSVDASVDKLISEYKTPAECVTVDLGAADPSNDEVKFAYDDLGRISYYTYTCNSESMKISYTYSEDSVEIYAFAGSIVVGYTKIALPGEYSAEVGFEVFEGYFFKGYDF